MKSASKILFKCLMNGLLLICVWRGINQETTFCSSLLGPAPDGAAGGGQFAPPTPPNNAAPGGFGGQLDSPESGSGNQGQNGNNSGSLP